MIEYIHVLKKENISVYLTKYKDIYTKYFYLYAKEIEQYKILLNSKFFINIHMHYRKNNEFDDDKLYKDSLEEFKKLKKLFKKGPKSLIKELEICLKNFNFENIEKQLSDELEIIENFFEVKKKNMIKLI